jgi:hypothetical protein
MSDIPQVTCPACRTTFALSEGLAQQVIESALRTRDSEHAREMERLRHEAQRRSVEQERLHREALERVRQEEQLRQKARSEEEARLLRDQLAIQSKLLQETRERESELRKKQAEIEERAQQIELEKQRAADEAMKLAQERFQLEKQELLQRSDQHVKRLEEALRQAQQGSQQVQGEALELDLEATIRQAFPEDVVREVPKGVRGADLVQVVRDAAGNECGTILWEAKNTRSWSEEWLVKLRDDRLVCRADVSILATVAMPRDTRNFVLREGTWVVQHTMAAPLAQVVRLGLIERASARRSVQNRSDKMSQVYEYMTGSEFRQRIEGILDAFSKMKGDLDAEKRAMQKIWAQREKQIDRILTNTAEMYGHLQGIAGRALPELPALQLPGMEPTDPDPALDDNDNLRS